MTITYPEIEDAINNGYEVAVLINGEYYSLTRPEPFTVDQCNREELVCLKQTMLDEQMEFVSWWDLSSADTLISDAEVAERYAGTTFVSEDFNCNLRPRF